MKDCPDAIVLPVALSAETLLPTRTNAPVRWMHHGKGGLELYSLGQHWLPQKTSSKIDGWRHIVLQKPCTGPLILGVRDINRCAVHCFHDTESSIADLECHLGIWELRRDNKPSEDLQVFAIARWLLGADRGHEYDGINIPFVWVDELDHPVACLETGLRTVHHDFDHPVLFGLVPNEFLPALAKQASDLLLSETWLTTFEASQHVAALRGY